MTSQNDWLNDLMTKKEKMQKKVDEWNEKENQKIRIENQKMKEALSKVEKESEVAAQKLATSHALALELMSCENIS